MQKRRKKKTYQGEEEEEKHSGRCLFVCFAIQMELEEESEASTARLKKGRRSPCFTRNLSMLRREEEGKRAKTKKPLCLLPLRSLHLPHRVTGFSRRSALLAEASVVSLREKAKQLASRGLRPRAPERRKTSPSRLLLLLLPCRLLLLSSFGEEEKEKKKKRAEEEKKERETTVPKTGMRERAERKKFQLRESLRSRAAGSLFSSLIASPGGEGKEEGEKKKKSVRAQREAAEELPSLLLLLLLPRSPRRALQTIRHVRAKKKRGRI